MGVGEMALRKCCVRAGLKAGSDLGCCSFGSECTRVVQDNGGLCHKVQSASHEGQLPGARAGFYGGDCSLSLDPATGQPQLLAGRGYAPRARRPWVYVYELPPAISTWWAGVGGLCRALLGSGRARLRKSVPEAW